MDPLAWLLEGDPAIRWQALRDLQKSAERTWTAERRRVAREGWGARLLVLQDDSGRWGGGLYNPKWTSTTYTLLLLRAMGLPPGNRQALKGCRLLVDQCLDQVGGETCVSGMILSAASYFGLEHPRLECIAQSLLGCQMEDGGWNCRLPRGATHGSFHTTISVLEALLDFERFSPRHAAPLRKAQARGREFLLRHRLFRSHRTGEIVHPAMTRFSFPPRWHYDVLRGLDYFRDSGAPFDERLGDAIALVERRRSTAGCWPLQNRWPGRTHFEMEAAGRPSRWNTLRALRVLDWWSNARFTVRNRTNPTAALL
jgi:hypothetical protein